MVKVGTFKPKYSVKLCLVIEILCVLFLTMCSSSSVTDFVPNSNSCCFGNNNLLLRLLNSKQTIFCKLSCLIDLIVALCKVMRRIKKLKQSFYTVFCSFYAALTSPYQKLAFFYLKPFQQYTFSTMLYQE